MSLLLALTAVVTVTVSGSITGGNSSVVGSAAVAVAVSGSITGGNSSAVGSVVVTGNEEVVVANPNLYGKRPKLMLEAWSEIHKVTNQITGNIQSSGSQCSGQALSGIDGKSLQYFGPKQKIEIASQDKVMADGLVVAKNRSVCYGGAVVAVEVLAYIEQSGSSCSGKSRSRNMRKEDEDAIFAILKLKFDSETK